MWKFFIISFIVIIFKFKYSNCENICSLCDCKGNVLDCSEKKITTVPDDFRNGNKSIILMDHNFIIHIRKLPRLKVNHLSFAYNTISVIDDSAFQNLYNMTSLDLSNNHLTSVNLMPHVFRGNYLPDMYEPLRSLKELNLANNLIHTLHPQVFEHLPNLEKLILNKNSLVVLSHGIVNAISSLPHLKELQLSNTSLKALPDDVFHGPKYLEILDLSYNKFREPPIQLENTHSLRWLSLNGNPVKYIENFVNLPLLQVLHLSKMPELIAIENRSLSSLPLLKEFYCSGNRKLVKISEDAFSSRIQDENEEGEVWPPLKILVLNNNALRYIESHLVSRWENLEVINLQQNPWKCDCENQWMVSTLTPIIEKNTPELLNSFRCSEPKNKKNIAIVNLANQMMSCSTDGKSATNIRSYIGIAVFLLATIPSIFVAFLYYSKAATTQVPCDTQYEMYNYMKLRNQTISLEQDIIHF